MSNCFKSKQDQTRSQKVQAQEFWTLVIGLGSSFDKDLNMENYSLFFLSLHLDLRHFPIRFYRHVKSPTLDLGLSILYKSIEVQ